MLKVWLKSVKKIANVLTLFSQKLLKSYLKTAKNFKRLTFKKQEVQKTLLNVGEKGYLKS